ncbi:unnamed protein product [Parnassius mnemosyne]|uniref:Uncharacterized protein n=1 Tax=Parnassius mnemosyne TaxID=213953 RepID=A0AAV1M3C1_9NEOP
MFYILVIFSVFVSAYAQIDSRPVVHLPPAVSEFVKQVSADCLKEIKAEPEVAKRFFGWQFDEDEISKKFRYCLCLKTNYLDEDNHLNDGFIKLFDSSDRKEDVQKVLETCNKIKKKDPLDTLFEIALCFYKNSPVLLLP